MNWIFANNINTDLITPGRYNITTDPQQLAEIAFIEYLPEFKDQVSPGDYIVAGENFGCGSSRETAVTALKACGIQAIVAKSFSRIFYRNCLNNGLLVIEADLTGIKADDELSLDLENQLITNQTTHKKYQVKIPKIMRKFYSEGGIIPFLKNNGLNALSTINES
jgi:3-isopropylmalate/(R)-2-methylmalate dehydratase small subunit